VSNGKVVRVVGKPQEIGRVVKEIRESIGMSMIRFARKVGISQAQVSRLEDGQQGFRTHTMQKIAIALDTPIVIYFGPKRKAAALASRE
jgi:transcriptional regulator with XRE-family HTH domain